MSVELTSPIKIKRRNYLPYKITFNLATKTGQYPKQTTKSYI